jgi:hypothetical protein
LNLQLWTSLFFFVLKLKKHFNISFFFWHSQYQCLPSTTSPSWRTWRK